MYSQQRIRNINTLPYFLKNLSQGKNIKMTLKFLYAHQLYYFFLPENWK